MKKQTQYLIQEIEAYRSHSLFAEAKKRCMDLAHLVRQSPQVKNKRQILTAVAKKIKTIENEARKFDQLEESVRMSSEEQKVVKRLFSSPKHKKTGADVFEGAMAFIVFGQYEAALTEFKKLINNDSLRVTAAKNIIRCYVGLSEVNDAIPEYHRWLSSSQFSPEQLEKVFIFFQAVLNQQGINKKLSKPQVQPRVQEKDLWEDEFVDVFSVLIPFTDKSNNEKKVELDVGFQKGNMISVILPRKNKDLVDYLKSGLIIEQVQFNSHQMIFSDSCNVSEKTRITAGPRKGDYAIKIKIIVS